MTGEGELVTEEMSAESAFEVLGHETRLEIIETLGASDESLSFSELRERVGERDSGQFNYHLDRVQDTFVRQDETGAYELTYAGGQVFGAVLAGRFTKTADLEDIPVGGVCPLCDGDLEGAYRNTQFTVTCGDCEETITGYPIPPGVLEPYDVDEFAEVAGRYLKTRQEMFERGFCESCAGPIEVTVTEADWAPEAIGASVIWECQRCQAALQSSLPAGLMHHSVVETFTRDHGRDPNRPIWEKGWLMVGEANIVEEDPVRVEVMLELEGERLELRLDDQLRVLEERRVES